MDQFSQRPDLCSRSFSCGGSDLSTYYVTWTPVHCGPWRVLGDSQIATSRSWTLEMVEIGVPSKVRSERHFEGTVSLRLSLAPFDIVLPFLHHFGMIVRIAYNRDLTTPPMAWWYCASLSSSSWRYLAVLCFSFFVFSI